MAQNTEQIQLVALAACSPVLTISAWDTLQFRNLRCRYGLKPTRHVDSERVAPIFPFGPVGGAHGSMCQSPGGIRVCLLQPGFILLFQMATSHAPETATRMRTVTEELGRDYVRRCCEERLL